MQQWGITSAGLERRIRARFPVLRLLQAFLPLRPANWLNSQGLRRARLPADIAREDVVADGVPCVWIRPQGARIDQVLLYFHGGGFVFGLTPLHVEMVAALTQRMRVPALLVDYRVAPSHPFPAALDDCVIVYHWLIGQGVPARNIVLGGDSAGANLTLTTMMRLRDSGEELPAGAACLSPVGRLTDNRPISPRSRDPLLPARALRTYCRSYVGSNNAHNPLISPLLGDWHGLPPLLVHAGEDEILRRDAVDIADAAAGAAVDVRLEISPRMWHVWQLYPQLPQAAASLDDIAGFFRALRRATKPHAVVVAEQEGRPRDPDSR